MKTFQTYTQTRASIAILKAVNEIRERIMVDRCNFSIDNNIEYNSMSGVCWLMIEDLNMSICATEFNEGVFIENFDELESELTIDEWLALQ